MLDSRTKLFDAEAELQYSANVATTQAGLDSAYTAAYYDTGGGYTEGMVVFDVTTLPKQIPGGLFRLRLQGGKNTSFSTIVNLVTVDVGDTVGGAGLIPSHTDDQTAGRYVVPFSNRYKDTMFRYLRAYCEVGGSIGTGITYSAFLTSMH